MLYCKIVHGFFSSTQITLPVLSFNVLQIRLSSEEGIYKRFGNTSICLLFHTWYRWLIKCNLQFQTKVVFQSTDSIRMEQRVSRQFVSWCLSLLLHWRFTVISGVIKTGAGNCICFWICVEADNLCIPNHEKNSCNVTMFHISYLTKMHSFPSLR